MHESPNPVDLAIEAVRRSHNDGYNRGIMAALVEMRFIAAVVPSSVSKQWILDEITRRANELEHKLSNS